MIIQNKIINHIMSKGRKATGEKILAQSLKDLQRSSSKNSSKIFQLAIIHTTPIFRLHKIRNKRSRSNKLKEIPGFIKTKRFRNSMAIKLILTNATKEGSAFYKKMNQEVKLSSQNRSATNQAKDELQKRVFAHKRLFFYYRWN